MRHICVIYLFLFSLNISAQSYKDDLFTSYFQQKETGWLASDGSISVELPDGRNIWFMGDSHIDQPINSDGEIPCLFNTRNCIVVQDANDLSSFETFYDENGADVYQKQFVKMLGDTDVSYWPSDAVVRGDTVYSFWQRYEYDPDAVWNINFTGMVIAKIKLPEITLVEVLPAPYTGWEYGVSVVWDEEDQYYYIYGKYVESLVFKPIVARCTYNNLLGNWEFFDGSGWSFMVDDATSIATEVSAAYSVFELNGKYYLFYQENGFLQCGLGRNMYIYSAAEPWGYNGMAHPQFMENNELLVNYNVNRTCQNPCQSDPFTATYSPDLYRPKFVRVPFCTFDNDISCIDTDDGVFPGDLNHDGIVNSVDVGLLGLNLYETGPPRTSEHQNNNWYAHPAQNWERFHLNNQDIKHSDSNGNGVIDTFDRQAVRDNMGRTWEASVTDEDPIEESDYQVMLHPVDQIFDGYLVMNVALERRTGGDLNLRGGYFTIDYSDVEGEISQAGLNFETSWLGIPGFNLWYEIKEISSEKKIEIGFTKTNNTNSAGNGVIGKLILEYDNTAARLSRTSNNMYEFKINTIGVHNSAEFTPIEDQVLQVNVGSNSCQANWTISENTQFQNDYLSNNAIETEGFVLIGVSQQVEYKASNRITLNSGFSIRAGADFRAHIEPCE